MSASRTQAVQAVEAIDQSASDVFREDEAVHVPAAVAELAESLKRERSYFLPDVPNWDDPLDWPAMPD